MSDYAYVRMASILVVEDEGDSREFVSRYLERSGHRVIAAENGRRALQLLLSQHPDLIVLDLRMPELDGISLLEVMRSYLRWHDLPVIILSAHGTGGELQKARDLGAFRIFHKANFRLAELAEAIAQATGGGSDTLAS
jgi:CheY-like chemotaxis protein